MTYQCVEVSEELSREAVLLKSHLAQVGQTQRGRKVQLEKRPNQPGELFKKTTNDKLFVRLFVYSTFLNYTENKLATKISSSHELLLHCSLDSIHDFWNSWLQNQEVASACCPD